MKIVYLIFLTFICFTTSMLSQTKITVCSTCKIASIKQAIKDAHAKDTILIKKGIYKENGIQITKPLIIIGENNPTIDGEFIKNNIITIEANNVSLIGFVIKNVSMSYTDDFAAIKVINSTNFTLENNKLDYVFFGISIARSKHGLIKNNRIHSYAKQEYSSGNSIHVWHSSYIKILNNNVSGTRDGIYLEFVHHSVIANNISENQIRYGLHFMFSNDNDYYNNTFSNNGAGVAVMFSKRIKMHQNTFKNNWGTASYGLLLKEIYDAEINDNLFEDNTIGINAEGSTRVNYTHNNFKNNGWAVKFTGACYDNKFEYNNFLYNTFDLSYSGNLNNNSFNSNYWSSYTGYDLDKNGVGDIPFRPVKLFSFIVNKTPESIVLLRSLFVDVINFSEKVSPIFTPDNLIDNKPLIKPFSKQ